jgi:hypothetical protein
MNNTTLSINLLKELLNTDLTLEQLKLLDTFLIDNLVKDAVDPFKQRIEKSVITGVRAMTQDIKTDELIKYLGI